MTAAKYPHDLVVTAEHLESSEWQQAIEGAKREGYSAMWSTLSKAAKEAMSEGKAAEGKVLWLLADACSMMLNPQRNNNPFDPFAVMEGKRSALPEDFTETDIEFFAEIAAQVDDPWLCGRLADLTWLCAKPRDPKYALMAIDAYRQLELDTETWIRGSRECWERAIRLALMLRDAAGDRLSEMRDAILTAFNDATVEDGYLGLWLADLVDEYRLINGQQRRIAEHLEQLADAFEAAGNVQRYRDYSNRAARWFNSAGDQAKGAEMTVAEAEGWVNEARERISGDNPSYMVAASFYENAIQVYRTIPRAERVAHRVDERLTELRTLLSEAGERSLSELGEFESPGIDISEIVESARESVRGETAANAIKAFCNLHAGFSLENARRNAEKRMREHPLQSLFPATVLSRDGRVIAKRPGAGLGSDGSDNGEAAARAEMIRDYGLWVGIIVQGNVWPGLEILRLEHRLRESDFVGLCSQSPIVPKDRIRLFGKALFAGYEGDFISALHLLTPQIEHMVRHHLKVARIKTTSLDLNGIENEIGLSNLMNISEIEEIFGENLSFELRALFCDPFGPNLRNETAHGLLSDESGESAYSIYAWWFALRLVFNTFWNAKHSASQEGDEGAEE